MPDAQLEEIRTINENMIMDLAVGERVPSETAAIRDLLEEVDRLRAENSALVAERVALVAEIEQPRSPPLSDNLPRIKSEEGVIAPRKFDIHLFEDGWHVIDRTGGKVAKAVVGYSIDKERGCAMVIADALNAMFAEMGEAAE